MERELGWGVVVREEGNRLLVESRDLDLGWRGPRGPVPGTGVRWRGALWEVEATKVEENRRRWRLRPWPEEQAVRGIVTLDPETLAGLVHDRLQRRRLQRLRPLVFTLLPILGLAPTALQLRWRDTLGLAPETATRLSALLEMAVGGLGLVQDFLAAFGGGVLLPPALRWLVFVGPFLFVEGLVRLTWAATNDAPLGSLEGLLLAPFAPRAPVPEITPPAPGTAFSPVRRVISIVLLSFAPAEYQVLWTVRQGLPRTLLTVLGGGTEFLGGLHNLAADLGAHTPWLLLDLGLLAEGTVRLAAAFRGRPLGSLAGLPFTRFWRRLLR